MVGRFQGPGYRVLAGARDQHSALARSLEITPSQLFSLRGAAARKAAKAEGAGSAPAEPVSTKTRRVEIEIGGAVVRVTADIAEDDLRRVLRAVRET